MSLCYFLTEHHTMKVYWGNGCTTPCILNLSTKLWLVVGFTPQPLNPQDKDLCTPIVWTPLETNDKRIRNGYIDHWNLEYLHFSTYKLTVQTKCLLAKQKIYLHPLQRMQHWSFHLRTLCPITEKPFRSLIKWPVSHCNRSWHLLDIIHCDRTQIKFTFLG